MSEINNNLKPSINQIRGLHESIALAHKLQQEEYDRTAELMRQTSARRKAVKTTEPRGCLLCLKHEGKNVVHSTSEPCAWSDVS